MSCAARNGNNEPIHYDRIYTYKAVQFLFSRNSINKQKYFAFYCVPIQNRPIKHSKVNYLLSSNICCIFLFIHARKLLEKLFALLRVQVNRFRHSAYNSHIIIKKNSLYKHNTYIGRNKIHLKYII